MHPAARAERFRALHRPGDPFLLPNAWDHVTAAALVRAGFAAVGTTSLGVAAAAGIVDGEGLSRDRTLEVARMLAPLPCLLTVDVEGGFGEDPGEVGALAAELAGIGVAGINLEDGRAGGVLADPDRQARLVEAAAAHLFVNARVDTYWVAADPPSSTAPTLDRARRYVDAGAGCVYVPGVSDERVLAELAGGVRAPLNALLAPGGPGLHRLAGCGVARVSTGGLPLRAAVGAVVALATSARDGGQAPTGLPGYSAVQALASIAAPGEATGP